MAKASKTTAKSKTTRAKAKPSTKPRAAAKAKTATKKTAATTKKKTAKASTKPRTASKAASTKAKTTSKKTTVKDEEVTIDRRATASSDRRESADDRRQDTVPVENDLRTNPERREKVSRRRQIDPTTCERDYNNQEIEFMHALDAYKRAAGRMFPTCSEILEVVRDLGYRRLTPEEIAILNPIAVADDEAAQGGDSLDDQPNAESQSEELVAASAHTTASTLPLAGDSWDSNELDSGSFDELEG